MSIWRDCGDQPCMTQTDVGWIMIIVGIALIVYAVGEYWRNRP